MFHLAHQRNNDGSMCLCALPGMGIRDGNHGVGLALVLAAALAPWSLPLKGVRKA